jgi:hypothetical protein
MEQSDNQPSVTQNTSGEVEVKKDAEYYVIFFNKEDEIFYSVGFDERPAVSDIVSLIDELTEDPDFELGDTIWDSFIEVISREEYEGMEEE